jgi:hypothetical protein
VGGTWQHKQKLLAADGLTSDRLGAAVAVDAGVVAAGAPGDDIGLGLQQGSAYVFRWQTSAYAQEAKLVAADGALGDEFGAALELDGGVLAVGAPRDDVAALLDVGSAYLHHDGGGDWVQEHLLPPAAISASAQLGLMLALDGGLLALGVASDAVGTVAVQGSACVFKALPAAWTWLGHALPGVHGAPDLVAGGTLAGGSPVSFVLDDARELAVTALTFSLVQINLPFKGGTLVPAPDIVIAGLLTSAEGGLSLGGVWPGGIPSGTPVVYQAWFVDPAATQGFSGTNAIIGTVP